MEDDCDDLPMISVNTPSNSKNTFSMPPADVLASQRAREVECERELQLLRSLHSSEGSTSQELTVRSDSSGSEGESSLVAAVDKMRVQPEADTSQTLSTASVNLIEIISKLLYYLPKKNSFFVWDYLQVLRKENSAMSKSVTLEILEGLEAAMLGRSNALDAPTVLCCSALLCALLVGGAPPGLRLRRALHALLQLATDEQVETLGNIMCETLRSPELLLELSDAVQGEPGAPRNLATHLIKVLLDQEQYGTARGRCTQARLVGRAAALGVEHRAPLPPPRLPRDAPETDRHKVAVLASKLQLLLQNTTD